MALNSLLRMLRSKAVRRKDRLQKETRLATFPFRGDKNMSLCLEGFQKTPGSLKGRFRELKVIETSAVTSFDPESKEDFVVEGNVEVSTFRRRDCIPNLCLTIMISLGVETFKSGLHSNQKNTEGTLSVLDAPSGPLQLLDASVKYFGSETHRPVYVLPDCSVHWKSEEDEIRIFNQPLDDDLADVPKPNAAIGKEGFPGMTKLSNCARVWKPVQDGGLGDIWNLCLCEDDFTKLGEWHEDCLDDVEAGEKIVEDDCRDSDSGYSDSEAILEDQSLVLDRNVCLKCHVPFEPKFLNERSFVLLENCEHIFCHSCVRGFSKLSFNALINSATCPVCGVESEAVAASRIILEGMEKREFFNDFLFNTCISPEEHQNMNTIGTFLLRQIGELDPVHDYDINLF